LGRRRKLKPGEQHEGDVLEARVLELDRVARGIAKTAEGIEVRAPGVLPGELVRARVVHIDRDRRRHSALLEVIEPAAERVDPRCAHFLECGGCDLLHAGIAAQHRWKRSVVAGALGLELERVDAVIASPRELGYRALAKWVIGEGAVLGSYKPGSHDVTDMGGCLVHAPEAERIADAIRSIMSRSRERIELRYLLIRASLDAGRAIVTLVVAEEAARGIDAMASVLAKREDVALVVRHVNASTGDELLGDAPHVVLHERGPLTERIGDAVHLLRPGAFAQVNPLAASELYRALVRALAPQTKRILDLYAGSGGISFQLALSGAREVVAVEANKDAVRAARASLPLNQLEDRVRFEESSAEEGTRALIDRRERFDAVVLNPPRKGASLDVLLAIAELRPEQVMYVSCDPQTLARDLAVLAEHGYALERIMPVDLFPHTRHIETIASLGRITAAV
jgi:23S rRNA (uracil1939-C5)-methyltransferase